MTLEQQLIVAENSVNKYRSTVEQSYLADTQNLYNKSEELKLSINRTTDGGLNNLFNIMSVVDKGREIAVMMNSENIMTTSQVAELQTHWMSDCVKQITEIHRKNYESAQSLAQELSALISTVYINSNYSSPQNLKFCLSEIHETRAVSCLEDNVRAYAEFLSRLKVSVNRYSETFLCLETEIFDTTRTKLQNVLNESRNFTQYVVKELFNVSNITKSDLISFANSQIVFNFENVNDLFNTTEDNFKESINVFTKYNNDLHNYKSVFSNIQNIINVTGEIILTKIINSTYIEHIVEESNRLKNQSLVKLSEFLNDTFLNLRQLEESLEKVKAKLDRVTHVKTLCDTDDFTELTYLLYEQMSKSTEIQDDLMYLMNVSITILETLGEHVELNMQTIYNQYSISIRNISESLLKEYNIKFKDILKYELNKIDNAKKETVETLFKIEVSNRKNIIEYKSKLLNFTNIFNIFFKIFEVLRNKNETESMYALKHLNETLSNTYLSGKENTLNKIRDIETYDAINKTYKFAKTFKNQNLKLSCKSDVRTSVSAVESLQCFENERTRFSEFTEALHNDYSQSYRELSNIVSMLFYDVQHSIHAGIKETLSSNSVQLEIDDVFECLHNIDFRKFDSVKLRDALNICNSFLPYTFN